MGRSESEGQALRFGQRCTQDVGGKASEEGWKGWLSSQSGPVAWPR